MSLRALQGSCRLKDHAQYGRPHNRRVRAFLPVILSGGAGARLWPVSREALPKPFIRLPDGETLLLKTMRRAAGIADGSGVLAVTNREYFFLTRDEYETLGKTSPALDFLLEPVSRNTAPAICAAALHAARVHGGDALMLVLPADHLIMDEHAFRAAVMEARDLAAEGWLVTFGVRPTRPETGFGYIEAGELLSGSAFRVERFVEKPDRCAARAYMADGRYTWNSGMLCASASAILDAMQEHAPEVFAAVEASIAAIDHGKPPRVLAEAAFAKAPDVSFDYAILEKAARRAVVPAAFDWNDIGSWSALAQLTAPDAQGNRFKGEAMLIEVAGCFVQSDRMIAAVGVDNLLIIDTPDALLVSSRDRAQDVKSVVQRLKLLSHKTVRLHRTVHRPWGSYTVLEEGARFKIKRIVVRPGGSLSLQMHHHRSEHWVVVSGLAKVLRDKEEIFVRPDESTYIRSGTVHRLSNPGAIDCVMIEVQTGDYVGEDDILRLDDQYGRS
jgi:mannose-1-phosphate guanylyltransferase/mannose-6-phosphate isomerase